MRRVVVDATVLAGWFVDGKGHAAARALRRDYQNGTVAVIVPAAARLDLLDAIGDRLSGDRLARFATLLDRIGLEYREAPAEELASWMSRGLTASEAARVAVATAADLRLLTADPRLVEVAAAVVEPLT